MKGLTLLKTLVINISDDMDIVSFSNQLKKQYPALEIASPNTNQSKKFIGTDDKCKEKHMAFLREFHRLVKEAACEEMPDFLRVKFDRKPIDLSSDEVNL